MNDSIDTEAKLIKYLKRFKWCVKLEVLMALFFRLISFSLAGFFILWLIYIIAEKYDYVNLRLNPYVLAVPTGLFFITYSRKIYQRIIKRPGLLEIAEEFERRHDLAGEVISSADYVESSYEHHKVLEKVFIGRTYEKLSHIRISSLLQKNEIIKSLLILGILTTSLLICIRLFTYTPLDSLRITLFGEKVHLEYEIEYPNKLIFGRNFHLQVTSNCDKAFIFIKADKTYEQFPLEKKLLDKVKSMSLFKYKISSVDQRFSFFVTLTKRGTQIKSPVYHVDLEYLPVINSVKATLTYPENYQEPAAVQNHGDVIGFKDTKVELEVISNNYLQSAEIDFDQMAYSEDMDSDSFSSSINMVIDGKKATAEFKISNTTDYRLIIHDVNGYEDSNLSFKIEVLEDNPPNVSVIKPENDLTIKSLEIQPIVIEADDDYLIKKIILIYKRISSQGRLRKRWSKTLKFKPDNQVRVKGVIPLSKLNLHPGDSLEYHVKTIDNNKQTVESFPLKLIYPEVKKFLKEMDQEKGDLIKQVKRLLIQFRKLKKEKQAIVTDNEKSKNNLKKKLKMFKKRELHLQKKTHETFIKMEEFEQKLDLQKTLPVQELKEEMTKVKQIMSDLLEIMDENKVVKLKNKIRQIIKEARQMKKMAKQLNQNKKKYSSKEFSKKKRQLKIKKKQLNKNKQSFLQELAKIKSAIKKGTSTKKTKKIRKLTGEIEKLMAEVLRNIKKIIKKTNELETLRQGSNQIEWKQNKVIKRLEKNLEQLRKMKELQNLIKSKYTTEKIKRNIASLNKNIKKNKSVITYQEEAENLKVRNRKLFNTLTPKKAKPLLDIEETKKIKKQIQDTLKKLNSQLDKNHKKRAAKSARKLYVYYSSLEKMIQTRIRDFQQSADKEIMTYIRTLIPHLRALRRTERKKTKGIDSLYKNNRLFTDKYITKLTKSTIYSLNYVITQRALFDQKLESFLNDKGKRQFLILFAELKKNLNGIKSNFSTANQSNSTPDVKAILDQQKLVLANFKQLISKLSKLKKDLNESIMSVETARINQFRFSDNFSKLAGMQLDINKGINKLRKLLSKRGKWTRGAKKSLRTLEKQQNKIARDLDEMQKSDYNHIKKNHLNALFKSLNTMKREIKAIMLKLRTRKIDKVLVKKTKKLQRWLFKTAKKMEKHKITRYRSKKDRKNPKRKRGKPKLLQRERNLLKTKKDLRKALKNKKSRLENMKNLTPKQRKMVEDYFGNLHKYSVK